MAAGEDNKGGDGKGGVKLLLVCVVCVCICCLCELGCDFFAPIHKYTNTQKMVFLLCEGFYLRNHLLCICFAKKVISMDRYTDTHTK